MGGLSLALDDALEEGESALSRERTELRERLERVLSSELSDELDLDDVDDNVLSLSLNELYPLEDEEEEFRL